MNAVDWSSFNASPSQQIDSWLNEHTTAFERTACPIDFNVEEEAFAIRMR